MILVENEIAWLAINVAKMTGENAVIATAVAMAESGGNTDIIGKVTGSPNRDLGLWQMSTKWQWDKLVKFRWRDPYDNARMMRLVYDGFVKINGDGWTGWSVYTNGAYQAHMDAARLAVQHPWEPPPAQAGWRTTI